MDAELPEIIVWEEYSEVVRENRECKKSKIILQNH